MARQLDARKQFLAEATSRYHASVPGSPAEQFLEKRGLMKEEIREVVARFRFGFVSDPLPGHEMYRGMLAIPYLRVSSDGQWSVTQMRFRCLEGPDAGMGGTCAHEYHGKYNTVAGDKPRLYNTLALIQNDDWIAITEGEIDAVTATVNGIPAVGVPGAKLWHPRFREPFLGYESVYVLADGDKAGVEFAEVVARNLPNAKIIPMPDGEDVNSLVCKEGVEAITRRLKK